MSNKCPTGCSRAKLSSPQGFVCASCNTRFISADGFTQVVREEYRPDYPFSGKQLGCLLAIQLEESELWDYLHVVHTAPHKEYTSTGKCKPSEMPALTRLIEQCCLALDPSLSRLSVVLEEELFDVLDALQSMPNIRESFEKDSHGACIPFLLFAQLLFYSFTVVPSSFVSGEAFAGKLGAYVYDATHKCALGAMIGTFLNDRILQKAQVVRQDAGYGTVVDGWRLAREIGYNRIVRHEVIVEQLRVKLHMPQGIAAMIWQYAVVRPELIV